MLKSRLNIVFLLVFVFSVGRISAKQRIHKDRIVDIEYFRQNKQRIISLEGQDVRIEKLANLRGMSMLFYTIGGDSTNLYVFTRRTSNKNNKWQRDTVLLRTVNGESLNIKNLSIYSLEDKDVGYYVNVFCGDKETYCKTIRNKDDLSSPFTRVGNFNTGKIMGMSHYLENNHLVAYFRANSASLLSDSNENTSRGYLYKISRKLNNNFWNEPEYVFKHNIHDFAYYDFSKHKSHNKMYNYAVMSFSEDKVPYVMKTMDSYNDWQYPQRMSVRLIGHGHKVYIEKGIAYVVFYRKIGDDTLSNMYVWYGKVKDFEKGCISGGMLKVTSNEKYLDMSVDEKLKLNSLMEIDIFHAGKKVIAVISSKWDENLPSYAIKVEIEQKRLHNYTN